MEAESLEYNFLLTRDNHAAPVKGSVRKSAITKSILVNTCSVKWEVSNEPPGVLLEEREETTSATYCLCVYDKSRHGMIIRNPRDARNFIASFSPPMTKKLFLLCPGDQLPDYTSWGQKHILVHAVWHPRGRVQWYFFPTDGKIDVSQRPPWWHTQEHMDAMEASRSSKETS